MDIGERCRNLFFSESESCLYLVFRAFHCLCNLYSRAHTPCRRRPSRAGHVNIQSDVEGLLGASPFDSLVFAATCIFPRWHFVLRVGNILRPLKSARNSPLCITLESKANSLHIAEAHRCWIYSECFTAAGHRPEITNPGICAVNSGSPCSTRSCRSSAANAGSPTETRI